MAKRLFDGARRGLILAGAAAVVLAAVPQAQAAWPEKPIRLVLPFGAGGVGDVTARIVAEKLGDKLGQRFAIENTPGPGGISAARAVTTAQPDGYTLGLLSNGTAAAVATFKKLPFDPLTEFEMVSTMGQFDAVLAVSAKSEFKTLGDLLKAAKANPGKINVGTITPGSTQNLGGEYFKSAADIDVVIVPYKSSPDIVVGLLRNDVQMMLDFPPAVKGQVESGDIRLLATAALKRSKMFPDVPTAAEQGMPGFRVYSWNGIFAPKGTPKEIVDKLNAAIREVLAMKDVQEQLAKLSIEGVPSTPEELMQRLKDDIANLNMVVDKAGIVRK
ncbi:MAG TPA: tripartite tricarboxylate transporter substrate binding protein [Pseudolabrys sp.]|nr:tripartite tricarboxylate transporter substrate binding protein [Pseudolabrys sp.]